MRNLRAEKGGALSSVSLWWSWNWSPDPARALGHTACHAQLWPGTRPLLGPSAVHPQINVAHLLCTCGAKPQAEVAGV